MKKREEADLETHKLTDSEIWIQPLLSPNSCSASSEKEEVESSHLLQLCITLCRGCHPWGGCLREWGWISAGRA